MARETNKAWRVAQPGTDTVCNTWGAQHCVTPRVSSQAVLLHSARRALPPCKRVGGRALQRRKLPTGSSVVCSHQDRQVTSPAVPRASCGLMLSPHVRDCSGLHRMWFWQELVLCTPNASVSCHCTLFCHSAALVYAVNRAIVSESSHTQNRKFCPVSAAADDTQIQWPSATPDDGLPRWGGRCVSPLRWVVSVV